MYCRFDRFDVSRGKYSIVYDFYIVWIRWRWLHLYLECDGFYFLSVQRRRHWDDPGVPVDAEVGPIFTWSDWEEAQKQNTS